jgi:lipoate-protein ligase A
VSHWRWLQQPTAVIPDYAQMAVDQAILESYKAGLILPTVRVYSWSSPFVTYGRLQDRCQVAEAFPSMPIGIRPTGGSAVLHGDDLTVSVITDAAAMGMSPDRGGLLRSYERILDGVIETLKGFGVQAVAGLQKSDRRSPDCFASVGKCDVVDAETGIKIVGCAQLRSRGSILQQISIRPHQRYYIGTTQFVERLKHSMATCLAVDRWDTTNELTTIEQSRAQRIVDGETKEQ